MNEKLIFGHYFVAFIDLLGQRDKLKNLDALPSDDGGPDYDEFVQVVKDTVGAVEDLQRSASDFFTSFISNNENSVLKEFPGYERINKTEIKFQHFSDGLVIYIPLRTDNDFTPSKSIYGALVACGGLCLLGLAKKRPIRIGISIGVAAELRKNELYGKAVADAYEMESLIAKYPRAVVSNDVIKYLLSYANQTCKKDDFHCQMTKKMAQDSLEMLTNDFDGNAIVNYLGEYFQKNISAISNTEVFELAYKFIQEELEHHQKTKNTKLAFRYSILHGYFYEHYNQYIKSA